MTDATHDLTSEFDGDLPESVDEAAIKRMKLVAHVLDDAVRVPGTDYRVGLDPVLGLLPGSGDLVGGALSLYIVLESARLGVSFSTLVRMLANVTADVAVGAIPYVGDFFDAAWKANKRNLELALEDLATEAAGAIDDDSEPADEDVVEIEIE